MADDRIRAKYNIDGLLRAIPGYRADFFTGFVPTAEQVQGWRRSAREQEPEVKGRAQLRTIWDNPHDRTCKS